MSAYLQQCRFWFKAFTFSLFISDFFNVKTQSWRLGFYNIHCTFNSTSSVQHKSVTDLAM